MHDLGDVVSLTVNVKDSTGALANATSVVLTITLPDGTTSTPSVTNTSTGVYAASYTPTQYGRHSVRWVATGAITAAYPETFNVSEWTGLISLADARLALNLTSTTHDEDLRTWIVAATPVIEDIVGPIVRQTCDEWHDGGAPTIKLLKSPVISITAVKEVVGGGTVHTLTAQDLAAGNVGTYGYTADLSTGLITRRAVGSVACFARGSRNINVTYVAGRTVLPENVRLATMRLVAHNWSHDRRYGPAATEMEWTPSGYAVPKGIIAQCGGEIDIPGIA